MKNGIFKCPECGSRNILITFEDHDYWCVQCIDCDKFICFDPTDYIEYMLPDNWIDYDNEESLDVVR